ncbi:MAG: GNAT family N-acetyltransferase [Candidatus Tectomicrobia bacterium]|uniref:GNAT family N-acetyltransferase n=1 Tax=Tectimicrobiota bacterium TaxID=2528274 RepID=A0A938AZF9_UNCTE|nr:GNAT family N-acetyltransferase [Candidatus Tectomicrobia bacterium]
MGWLFAEKTLCLFEVDLKGGIAADTSARLAVEYRCLDAASWVAQRHTGHIGDRYLFPARFARGEQFWTVQQDDKILAYCWATQEPVEIGEIRCTMHPRSDETYFYDAFTFADYRGQNLYPALLQRMLQASRQHGLRRALIFVMSDNMASIRGVHKAGFHEFQRVTYRHIFGFGRYTYRPQLQATAGVDLRHV